MKQCCNVRKQFGWVCDMLAVRVLAGALFGFLWHVACEHVCKGLLFFLLGIGSNGYLTPSNLDCAALVCISMACL